MKTWLWPEVGESGEGCARVCWPISELEHFLSLSTFWSFIISFTSILQLLLCCPKGVASSGPGIAASSRRAQGHLLEVVSWMCSNDGGANVSPHPWGERGGSGGVPRSGISTHTHTHTRARTGVPNDVRGKLSQLSPTISVESGT